MKLRKPRNPVSQYAHKRKAGPHVDRKKEGNKNECRQDVDLNKEFKDKDWETRETDCFDEITNTCHCFDMEEFKENLNDQKLTEYFFGDLRNPILRRESKK